MDIKPIEDPKSFTQLEYNLMEIIFNPSKHSPPNSFIKTLKKRYDVYYAINTDTILSPKIGFIVQS